jgi:hypothetical protein
MRAMIRYGVFSEVGEDVYEHNALSTALSTDPLQSNLLPM